MSIIGPSGCGKTTLLRAIAGLLDADSGEVTVFGETPAEARANKLIGWVPQRPGLLPWRTTFENAVLLRDINSGVGPWRSDAEVVDLLDAAGLSAALQRRPNALSLGMQQRVSLVRAFAVGAPLLLMDEPFAALDEMTRTSMRYLLLDLWSRTRATIVFVTHSLAEAVALSDRVLTMGSGQLVDAHTIDLSRPCAHDLEDQPQFVAEVTRVRNSLKAVWTI